jgi:hypothetical protein
LAFTAAALNQQFSKTLFDPASLAEPAAIPEGLVKIEP